MSRSTVFVAGRGQVPLRPWEVDLATMSEPALARLMRALVSCHGQITCTFTLGRPGDWRASLGLMVLLPDGFLDRFIEQAKPWRVGAPKRVAVGVHRYRCGVDGCEDVCPPGHHGGEEWRQGERVGAAR